MSKYSELKAEIMASGKITPNEEAKQRVARSKMQAARVKSLQNNFGSLEFVPKKSERILGAINNLFITNSEKNARTIFNNSVSIV